MYKIIGGGGKEYGPVDLAQMQRWLRENRINGTTLVQASEGGEWKPLSSYPEFAAAPALPPQGPAPAPGLAAPLATSVDVPSYLVPAILVTLLCCLPMGVPAIVYASQVTSRLGRGDIAGAQAASGKARTWCWITFVVGAIWNTIFSIMVGRMIQQQLRF